MSCEPQYESTHHRSRTVFLHSDRLLAPYLLDELVLFPVAILQYHALERAALEIALLSIAIVQRCPRCRRMG